MKASKTILIILTAILSGTTFLFYEKVKTRDKIITDREKIIINYKKVINAIGHSENINIESLKSELSKDFEISENTSFHEKDKEYYLVLQPKDNEINKSEIWEFLGFEIILDKEKKFKTLSLYKP